MTARVVVVGDLMTDVVAQLAAPPALGSDTAARIRLLGGGSGANTACWLAVAGVEVTFVGRIGDDALGRERRRELAAIGVHPALAVDPERPSGACVVLVGPDAERSMLPDRGANDGLRPQDLADEVLEGADHLHLSGYLLLGDGSRTAAQEMLARARRRGLTISVDPSSAAPLHAVGPEAFLAAVDGGDLCLPNEDEAAVLGGPERLLASFGAVVVKRGAAGASWVDRAGRVDVPAAAVTVVDTTGAGDAFGAGLLAAWLSGAGPAESLLAGTRLAGQVVSQVGGRPRLHRR